MFGVTGCVSQNKHLTALVISHDAGVLCLNLFLLATEEECSREGLHFGLSLLLCLYTGNKIAGK